MRLSVEIMDLSSYQEDCGGDPILKESKLIQCFKKDKQMKKSIKELIASPENFIDYTKRMYLTDGKRAGDLLLFLQNLDRSIEVKE
jgi:translation elongation factor EF-Tu-like GTPase